MSWDPLDHGELTELYTRREVYRLTGTISRLLDHSQVSDAALMAGIASAFIAACDECGESAEAVLHQVWDAIEAGDLSVTDAEVSDIDQLLEDQ